MLRYAFLALFLGVVYSAQLQLYQGPNQFAISALYTGVVEWTLNGQVYNHLQQLSPTCGNLSTPVSQGAYSWACGPFDTLKNAQPTCGNGQILKFISGTFQCANDNDALGSLVCNSNEIPKMSSANIWVCSSDSNEYDSLPTCTLGQFLQWDNSTGWGCTTSIPNSDVGNLLCSPGDVLKFNSSAPGKYSCGSDIDYIPTCVNGQTLVYNGTGWTCGEDTDTIATLTGCDATNPYPKFDGTSWVCQSQYVDYVAKKRSADETEAFSAEISVLSAIVANTGSSGSALSFPAKWGGEANSGSNFVSDAHAILPVNGTIYSLRLYMDGFSNPSPFPKVLSISLLLNKAIASTFNVTIAPGAIAKQHFTSAQFSIPFAEGTLLSAIVSTVSPALTYANGRYAFYFYAQI